MLERRYSQVRGRRLSLYEAGMEAFATSPVGYQYLLRLAPRIDKRLIPFTDGRWSSAGKGLVGILTSTGAKSGAERVNPVTAMPREDHFILVASNYGRERSPAWAYNLRANPRCRWFFDGAEREMVATELDGEEREDAFAFAADFYVGYAAYAERAAPRVIPVFRLDAA